MRQTKIHILNDVTINQIAAGEVVENPACVIKELVENAIDAGATEVAIETKAGGRGLIRVADDGCGMGEDDLLLSIERHATSKLTSADDLWHLSTLGFRGEALPSIASISKMTIHSATHSGNGGALLKIVGGKIENLRPLPRQKGTTVEVGALFYNVPARKQFQKTLRADRTEIHKVLIKCILGHPGLALSWVDDDKPIFAVAGQDFAARVEIALGGDFLKNAHDVQHQEGSMKLVGHIASPLLHRPNRSGQYLFINQRSVHSPFIADRVLQAYGTRLATHRYPLFILHLTLPPPWIDVNVHPQKKEIRIRESVQVESFLLQTIQTALARISYKFSDNSYGSGQSATSSSVSEPLNPYLHEQSEVIYSLDLPSENPIAASGRCGVKDLPSYITQTFNFTCPDEGGVGEKRRMIGKIKNYIFLEEAEGIRIIDTSRALERLIFDEMCEKEEKPSGQMLLIPLQINVTKKEREVLIEHLSLLNEKGISIRHFGGDTFIIDAIPALLQIEEIPDLIFAYLEEGKWPKTLSPYLKKRAFTHESGIMLVEKLFRCQNPHLTPDGKRIHYLLDANSLTHLFTP